MRFLGPALLALLVAASASAKSAPTYSVTFAGTGSEHQLDQQQNVQDSGLCDSGETVDVTATLTWKTTFTSVRATSRAPFSAPGSIAGSQFTGTHVKDACGLPLDQAPAGWVSQATCSADLVPGGPPSLEIEQLNKATLLVGVTAPPLATPVGQQCSINPRNDQLTAHVAVATKKLAALAKGKSLTFVVGTSAGSIHDVYRPSNDCSQPTKPYDGYRTEDHCRDDLSWSGTVTIKRVS